MLQDRKFSNQEIQSPALSHLPDRPSAAGISAADLKAVFGHAARVKEIMTRINQIIDDLTAETAGNDIGVILDGLLTTLQNALQDLSDLIAAGRVDIDSLLRRMGAAETDIFGLEGRTTGTERDLSALVQLVTDEVARLDITDAEKAPLVLTFTRTLQPTGWLVSGNAYKQSVSVPAMIQSDLIAWGHPAGVTEEQLKAAASALMRMENQATGWVDFIVHEPPVIPVPVLIVNHGRDKNANTQ